MFLLSRFIGNPNAKMPGAGYSGRAGDMYSYSTLYYKVSNIGAAKGIECTAAIQFARQYHIRQHILKTLLRMVVIAFLSFHFALFGFDGSIIHPFTYYVNMYIGK